MANKSKKPQRDQKSDSSKKKLSDSVKVALISLAATVIVAIISYLIAPIVTELIARPASTEAIQVNCIYPNGYNDTEAIPWLIEHEAQAVNTEDMSLIKTIFSEDAVIKDLAAKGGPTKTWKNPIDRYQPLFDKYDFSDATNTDIKAIISVSGDTAVYTSASDGKYASNNGQPLDYHNPSDANRWTATKVGGCWKITMFEFNVTK